MRYVKETNKRMGFTLMELMVASSVLMVAMSVVYGVFSHTLVKTTAARDLLNYSKSARLFEQKITPLIQKQKTFDIVSDKRVKFTPLESSDPAELKWVDEDEDPKTIKDNKLIFDPNTAVSDDEKVMATGVLKVPGESMFQVKPTTPDSLEMTFYLGLPPPESRDERVTDGTRGILVNVSAAPRGLTSVWEED